jgi:hypothetical protein
MVQVQPNTTDNQPQNVAERITGLLRQAFKALTVRADHPAPKKSRRKGDGTGEDVRRAFIRKHMRRLFRKIRRRMGDDCRDRPPSFDGQQWHRQQQGRAAPGSKQDHHRSSVRHGANYPAPGF